MSAAHVIADDAEALAVAAELAGDFRKGAAERDARRRLPHAELERLSASGLLAVTVPARFGGADIRADTLAEIFRLLAAADASLAQIPQSHFVYVGVLRRQGTDEQREFFFGEVLAGGRFGNAQSEAGTQHVQDIRTRLARLPDGSYVLDGVKHYSTGALFAHWIPVLARTEDDTLQVAYVPRDAPGLTVVDDWDGMGQRTTASGTVRLESVPVPADRVVPHHLTFQGPQLHGAVAQLLHAAIDAGIASGALAEAVEFVRTKSRPWFESAAEGHATAAEDPLLIQRFGELAIRQRAAQALLREAARAVDDARADLTDDSAAEASIAVATAKVTAAEAAVEVASALFEVSGTRSALDSLGLHRHWRDARTHTLHDPARWKVQHIGRYVLGGTRPPRHGLL
ncbi:SfnB family sulfur acquisition oxidoreductase [Streptomyces broussonetiae]|uniref:SfnB family sulfur acquisition oxidoreductase n=3 Tax=Streptomyces broussonetiae TaxID=2686304 RepID=A0A6I6N0J2_9ACTN|nr:SfnB family sulfur acquisition oxidoreductase [Streptomyces broussonetiae]QHA02305.1 SfnB family sulfur acquisition oxidoreductase [Streptomyces broussonetiae]